MKNEKQVTLSIDQAKLMFDTDSQELKDIALKTFPELNKSKYPMSHDELLDLLDKYCSEKKFKQHLAFIQLIALCDKWNEIDEFKIDWTDSNPKYSIMSQDGKIFLGSYIMTSFPLTFKTKGTRDLFYETFKDLIEQAKNLI